MSNSSYCGPYYSGNITTDDGGGPSQPVQALVVAVTTTGDATEDPLHNLIDIRAAVTVVANSVLDTAPMIRVRLGSGSSFSTSKFNTMDEDYDTMTTDDTEVMAQAPAPDADAIAIPLVLVTPSLTSTISGRLWRILFPLLLSSLLCLATKSQANRICILLLWWQHGAAVVVAPLRAPVVELAG